MDMTVSDCFQALTDGFRGDESRTRGMSGDVSVAPEMWTYGPAAARRGTTSAPPAAQGPVRPPFRREAGGRVVPGPAGIRWGTGTERSRAAVRTPSARDVDGRCPGARILPRAGGQPFTPQLWNLRGTMRRTASALAGRRSPFGRHAPPVSALCPPGCLSCPSRSPGDSCRHGGSPRPARGRTSRAAGRRDGYAPAAVCVSTCTCRPRCGTAPKYFRRGRPPAPYAGSGHVPHGVWSGCAVGPRSAESVSGVGRITGIG